MKKILFLFLLLMPVVQSLEISEIMYNPIQPDSYNEWIEIYADVEVNFQNLTLCNKQILPGYIDHSDTLLKNNQSFILNQGRYAVITDGGSGTDIYSFYQILGKTFHVDASTLCGGLTDSGKTLTFELNGNLIKSTAYANIAKERNSISSSTGIFLESSPTPGYSNEFIQEETANQSIVNQSENQSEQELVIPEQISEEIQDDSCDWNISILTNKLVFEGGKDFSFKIKTEKISGGKTFLSSSIMIFDEKNNLLKEYSPFTNSEATYSKTSTTYSPNIYGNLKIEANLNTDCLDKDLMNNKKVKNILVKTLEIKESKNTEEIQDLSELIQNSTLEIKDILLLNQIKAKFYFYRGNTSKYAVKIYLYAGEDKISENTIYLKNKFDDYEMLLSFQKEECETNYSLVVEGLDLKTEKNFILNQSCEKNNSIILPSLAELKSDETESKQELKIYDEKITNIYLALITFLILSVGLNIFLIWRR